MSKPFFHRVGKVKLEITRNKQGEYVDGWWTEGESEEVCIMVNIQPAAYNETLILTEADRTRYTLKVFSTCLLRPRKEGTGGWDADTFTYEDDTYEIMKLKHWNMGVLDHYVALACLCPRTSEEE